MHIFLVIVLVVDCIIFLTAALTNLVVGVGYSLGSALLCAANVVVLLVVLGALHAS